MYCSNCYCLGHLSKNCSRQQQTFAELEKEIEDIYECVEENVFSDEYCYFGKGNDEYGPYFYKSFQRQGLLYLRDVLNPPRFVFSKELEEKFTPILNQSLDILRSSSEELYLRFWAIVKNVKLLNLINSEVICFPQGSFHTNTFLPSSDIDLVVYNANIHETYNFLKKMKDHVKSVEFIHARVSIIKYYDSETNFQVDVSFENSSGYANGVRCNNCIQIHPILQPLSILLKKIFSYYNCGETFTGGINSAEIFQLSLMFVRFSPNQTLFQYFVDILNFLENTENFKKYVFHPVKLFVQRRKNTNNSMLQIIDSKDEKIILGKVSWKAEEFAKHARNLLQIIKNCNYKAFLEIFKFKRFDDLNLIKNISFKAENEKLTTFEEDRLISDNVLIPPNPVDPNNVMIFPNLEGNNNSDNVIPPSNLNNSDNVIIPSILNNSDNVIINSNPVNSNNVMPIPSTLNNSNNANSQPDTINIVQSNKQYQELYVYTSLPQKTFLLLNKKQVIVKSIKRNRSYLAKLKKNQLEKLNLSTVLTNQIYSNFSDFKTEFPAINNIDELY